MTKKILLILLWFFMFFGFGFAKYWVWGLDDINIISREERWADEWRRYWQLKEYQSMLKTQEATKQYLEELKTSDYEKYLSKTAGERITKARNDYLSANFKDNITIDKTVDYDGEFKLRRPLRYHFNKTAIVVHHTANKYSELSSADAVKAFLRSTYHYHAITKWRGDIGYNFIIDQYGNIYEWKAWWPWIIWAHVSRNNADSIWISLIGNFNEEEPTKEAIDALTTLSTALSKKYSINVFAKKNYHIESSKAPYLTDTENYSLIWHKDAGKTACPWTNLYNKLDEIRYKIVRNLEGDIQLTSAITKDIDKASNQTGANSASTKPNKTNTSKPTTTSTKKQIEMSFSGNFNLDGTTGTIVLPITTSDTIKTCEALSETFKVLKCNQKNGKLSIDLQYRWYWASGQQKIKATSDKNEYLLNLFIYWSREAENLLSTRKNEYITKTWFKASTTSSQKITYQIPKTEAKKLLEWNIKVLLYTASTSMTGWNIECEKWCNISVDTKEIKNVKKATIQDNGTNLKVSINWKDYTANEVYVSNKNIVQISNFERKWYDGTMRNVFKGNLIIKQDNLKDLEKGYIKKYVVINDLPFEDYMNWIGEISEKQSLEKIKAMSLIIKSYTLFYMQNQNKHPSIPAGARYNAVDDPRIFQKYVWEWFKRYSKKRYQALETTKDEVVTYNNFVPILPYFNCSAGFTFSGKEKYGWTDTPYLKSVVDVYTCDDFRGHGVGLSGEWAQKLAEQWFDYKQIINYYYDGLSIEKF